MNKLMEAVQKLAEKVDGLHKKFAEMVRTTVEATIKAEVAGRLSAIETALVNRAVAHEQEVKKSKEAAKVNTQKKAANIDAHEDSDGSSNTMAWATQQKINSADGLPIECVVKTEKKSTKKQDKDVAQFTTVVTEKVKTRNVAKKVKKEKDDKPENVKSEKIKEVKKDKVDKPENLKSEKLKEVKKEKVDKPKNVKSEKIKEVKKEKAEKLEKAKAVEKVKTDSKENHKNPNDVPVLDDLSISSADRYDYEDREKQDKCQRLLDAFITTLANTEEPRPRRKQQLKVISGVTLSEKSYDPLAKVEEYKLQKLIDYMKYDLDLVVSETEWSITEFFLQLMLQREVWPTEDYGWLNGSHIASGLLMLHRRSLRNPSPFHSDRIAFIDHWFVSSWVNDYKGYEKKTWEFNENYIDLFNGNNKPSFVSGKKWLTDVDKLFLCHHVNGNHWVALVIDLPNEVINVYDSILSVIPDDKKLLDELKPFTVMILALLNKMVSLKQRKKSTRQFKICRHKDIPQNKNPGDCGVYSLKYLECLAIGCTFDGLDDKSIDGLRRQMVADFFEELPEVR